MPLEPEAAASFTICAGVQGRASSTNCWEMLQFWQKGQVKLQPHPPILKIWLPGRKWWSGFFSMGSIWAEESLP